MPRLRQLVNDAYRELGEMGLNYTAVDQDDEVTRRRMRGKDVLMLFLGEELVGTASLEVRQPLDDEAHLYVSQLAVHPTHQRRGLGSQLMWLAEREARARGLRRVRLDTAIPARHLVRWYEKMGYRPIRETQWRGKTYRTVIMEKVLEETSPA